MDIRLLKVVTIMSGGERVKIRQTEREESYYVIHQPQTIEALFIYTE